MQRWSPREWENEQQEIPGPSIKLPQQVRHVLRKTLIRSLTLSGLLLTTSCGTPQDFVQEKSASDLLVGRSVPPSIEEAQGHPLKEFLDHLTEEEWISFDVLTSKERSLIYRAIPYVMTQTNKGPMLTMHPALAEKKLRIFVDTSVVPDELRSSLQEWAHSALSLFGEKTNMQVDFVEQQDQANIRIKIADERTRHFSSTDAAGVATTEVYDIGQSDRLLLRQHNGEPLRINLSRIIADFPPTYAQDKNLLQAYLEFFVKVSLQHELSHNLLVNSGHLPEGLNYGETNSIMSTSAQVSITDLREDTSLSTPHSGFFDSGNIRLLFEQDPALQKRDILYSLVRIVQAYAAKKH